MPESINSRIERLERLLDAPICIGGKTELQRRLEDRQLADIYHKHGSALYCYGGRWDPRHAFNYVVT